MGRIDVRDQILRVFKDKGFDEQNCGFFKEEDIIEIAEEIVKRLSIYDVVGQSEQLVCAMCEEPLEKVLGRVCKNTMCDRHR